MAERSTALAPIPGAPGIASLVPFGFGQQAPHPLGELLGALWENRGSLPYAWRLLRYGVCDCGLPDGVHLCTPRLRSLRHHTLPALAPADVIDIERLRRMTRRELHALGRIPYPFVYRRGDRGFTRISWDHALGIAGAALRETPPHRHAWLAASASDEANYVFAKAARLSGARSVDVCASGSTGALTDTIGPASTCSLHDLIGTDLVLLWGTSLASHPGIRTYLARAKQRGARVVVVNPTRESNLERCWAPSSLRSALFGTTLRDDLLQVAVGGDIALAQGVLKVLIERGTVDDAFVDAHTTGWDALKAQVMATSWATIESDSGVSRTQVEWLGELVGRARSMVTVWSWGLTGGADGVRNVEAVVNLHLARGAFGRRSCGVLPLDGRPDGSGTGDAASGSDAPPGSDPRAAAMATLDAIARGDVDVLYTSGSDRALEQSRLTDGLVRTRLCIHQDTTLNPWHLHDGETVLLLPAQTLYEQRGGGTITSVDRRTRLCPEIVGHPVIGEARSAYEIPSHVAIAASPALAPALTYPDSQAIRDEMALTVPLLDGVERRGDLGPEPLAGTFPTPDGTFRTPDGKARFSPVVCTPVAVPEGAFHLTTRRGGAANDVLIAASDLSRLHCHDGQSCVLVNDVGSLRVTLRAADVRPGVLQARWPESTVLHPRTDLPAWVRVVPS